MDKNISLIGVTKGERSKCSTTLIEQTFNFENMNRFFMRFA